MAKVPKGSSSFFRRLDEDRKSKMSSGLETCSSEPPPSMELKKLDSMLFFEIKLGSSLLPRLFSLLCLCLAIFSSSSVTLVLNGSILL